MPPQWPYWLYLTNFSIADRGWVHGWVDVGWSLAIEEQFYLVWPPVIWLCPPRVVAVLCAVIIVGEPVARVYARATDVEVAVDLVLTWFRLDGLAIGALLALAQRRGLLPSLDRWAPSSRSPGWPALSPARSGRPHMVVESVDAAVRLLVDCDHRRRDVGQCRQPAGRQPVAADALCGMAARVRQYSYCLYLIHAPVMRIVREYVFDPEEYQTLGIAPWIAQVLFYGAAIAPAFALAWLSWRMFEAPILRLKARFQRTNALRGEYDEAAHLLREVLDRIRAAYQARRTWRSPRRCTSWDNWRAGEVTSPRLNRGSAKRSRCAASSWASSTT